MAGDHQLFSTFAGFPYCDEISSSNAKIAILGIPYCDSYPGEAAHSAESPEIIRQESNRYLEDPVAWDFDLNGTLRDICGDRVVDCGNLPVTQMDPHSNTKLIQSDIQKVLRAGAIPVVLGGDDSIPIPVLRAFEDEEPFYILQLDAHIDWRDEVKGVKDGYSSTMRRASEIPWVKGIIQVGARGVGSAREEELSAAKEYGANLISANQFRSEGIAGVMKLIPDGSRCFLTMDFDVLDPSIMPAVGAPTPGGLLYLETIDLIHGVSKRLKIVGACLVEFAPKADLNNLGAITATRIAWNIIGAIARTIKKEI